MEGFSSQVPFLLLMLVIFVFFIILPQQRKVKKETPEEYASRMEYMRGKEQLELEAETQRLFIKAEKQYQNHCPIKHPRKSKCGVQG